MNKLEKVALRSVEKRGRPWVLIINNIHYFQNDEAGRNMILQLQQKAEAWAASGQQSFSFSSIIQLKVIFRSLNAGFQLVSLKDIHSKPLL